MSLRAVSALAAVLGAGLLFPAARLVAQDAAPQAPAAPSQEEPVRTGASAAVLIGYGHEFAQGLSGLNMGLGVAGGYTVPAWRLYVGGSVLGYFGSSERARSAEYAYENRHHEYALSIDLGYDAFIGRRWVLRPLLSGGMYIDLTHTTVGNSSTSARDLYGFVGVGGAALVRIGRLSLGAQLGIPIFPAAFISRLTITAGLSLGTYFGDWRAR